ncbi:MAG: hypothetical protein Q7V57_02530 [Actinomycetota bacterium]|nr:hypothetical protein [Actinomycetota bacterium]
MNQPTRRSQLNALKLHALVSEHSGGECPVAADEFDSFGGGAAVLVDGVAWVLLDDQPERGLGGALAWALRRSATALHVVAERGTGLLARRAAGFRLPISVWLVDGRALSPAAAEPLPTPPPPPAQHQQLAAMITKGGALPVEEHGVLGGEVHGLEVCRVVTDPHTGALRLDVGIGADDRQMFQMLHGDKPTVQALADVVAFVGAQRAPGAPRHPLNLLAQERLLRAQLIEQPGLIGAQSVAAAPPPLPRPNLKDPVPCVAVAHIDGRRIVVVCSSGVDLDLVPYAVDACTALGLGECRLVVPARDALPIQHTIAAAATVAITVVGLDAVA